MSSNIFVNAGAVAIIFLIMKFIEMRFIEKENKPLKELIKDTLIVYISVLSGFYLLDQVESNDGVSRAQLSSSSFYW